MSSIAIKQDAGSFGKGMLRGTGASLANTATLGQMTSTSGWLQILSGNSASNVYSAAIGPAENLSMAIGDMQGENLGNAAQAAAPAGGIAKAAPTFLRGAFKAISVRTGATSAQINSAAGIARGAPTNAPTSANVQALKDLKVTRSDMGTVAKGYADAAKAGKGGDVAMPRAEHFKEVEKIWND